MKEQIREMLMKAAGNNNTISYSEVGEVVGLDMANPGERSKLANTLDEINREEHERGRPLLSAVVVQKESGHPGTGFFESARELGKQKPDEDNQVFFTNELKRVFDAWMAAGQQNKTYEVTCLSLIITTHPGNHMGLPLQIIFFYFAVERSFADAEDFRGFFAVAFRFRQRVGDSLLFQFIQ